MSDEPKPHEDDAHHADAHAESHDAAPEAAHAPEEHAAEAAHAPADHAPEAAAEPVEHAEPVVAEAHVEDSHSEPEPAHAEPVAEAAHVEEAHAEPAAEEVHPVEAAHAEPEAAHVEAEPAHHEPEPVAEAVHAEPEPVHAEAPAAEEPAHVEEPVVTEAAHVEPEHTPEPEAAPAAHAEDAPASESHVGEAVAAAAAVGAVAAVAGAASSSSERRPIWSDQGDAPFDDGPTTPVYDRKARARTKSKGSGSAGSETAEIIKTIFFALLIALVLRTLAFQPFTIPSASMEPNLYEGDYIVVTKWSYGYSRHSIPFSPPLFRGRILGSAPERGDIVVFKLPRDNKTDYIKRVIGLPGDRVQMIANRLYINGQAVDDVVIGRSQIEGVFGPQPITRVRETLPGGKQITIQDFGPGNDLDDTPVYEVPAGFYFMMGDNRDNSIDSRVNQANGVGLVPAENLVGKAQIILFSWSPGAAFLKPWTWFSNLRPSRFFTVLD